MPTPKPTHQPRNGHGPVDFQAHTEILSDGSERVSPELVYELDRIFEDGIPDTVALASLLCKLTGRAEEIKNQIE